MGKIKNTPSLGHHPRDPRLVLDHPSPTEPFHPLLTIVAFIIRPIFLYGAAEPL